MKTRVFAFAALFVLIATLTARADDGVFVRFKLVEPAETSYCVQLGGFIHSPNWYLPKAVVPAGADRDKTKRLTSGAATEWFDLKAHCGKSLHGRQDRAGGVAEFPNLTVQVIADPGAAHVRLTIELATAPSDDAVVRTFDDAFNGNLTSVLISPNLKADAADLETATQMSARRLKWAEEATGGKRVSPKHHIIQTSFWGPQRAELNVQEGRVLWLLGFNVVGGSRPEVLKEYGDDLRVPGHTHNVNFNLGASEEQIDGWFKNIASKDKATYGPGVPYGFADEIAARPPIGNNKAALANFHAWLAARQIDPKDLGVAQLTDVVPLETPEAYKESAKTNEAAARRVFYYTSRFRQVAATQRIRWNTEAFHKYFAEGPITSTLVADHPYFGGTGLGMGFNEQNTAWGGWPLALDWFDLARRQAVDMIGIEDWMGLQYMYGPGYTWEGFQLMGFQSAMMRSGGRGETPIIAWITPSDETNLRLKSFSAIAQGAKHFFYWTYGPTATSTENYWSDLRGAYDGVARVSRQLAAAEHVISPGKLRPTRVALLYSISSDLWQPFDYRHMLERRGTYLSLVHGQYMVDMLTEEDVEAGRLKDYAALYVTDPCIAAKASDAIREWVRGGGMIYGSCAAGSRNEFGEAVDGLADVFGVKPGGAVTTQPGNYRVRAELNAIAPLDHIAMKDATAFGTEGFGVIGVKVGAAADGGGEVAGTFADGAAAVVTHAFGQGRAVYAATTPGISYIKDAKFVKKALGEKWPEAERRFINRLADDSAATPAVVLSSPVVEAGVYEAETGVAVVLANFTYEPIDALEVALPVRGDVGKVHLAASDTPIAFTTEPAPAAYAASGFTKLIRFKVKLGLDEIVVVDPLVEQRFAPR
ncbi:MAG: hypothetical protein GC159_24050 [Phycisphaera sp.]|nr:hypothetical protein [Phycisphaera sp.]